MTVHEPDAEHRRLLQSVVRTARAIFDAQASSIFLVDESSGELVFEAVSGRGEEHLVGRRLDAGRGIAGWVLESRQSVEVEDLEGDPSFARDFAESTLFVPRSLMAAPLLHGDTPLGVLEVLDRSQELRTPLAAMDLLALFADQASAALRLVQLGRRSPAPADTLGLSRVLGSLDSDRREAGRRVVSALEELLRTAG
ncbi:GAF domain-containing protein [Streptomyces sp. NBC_01465]|uniref:GAF domain-containing protein n=1 Tax=Streptomyces sp. NBC_01465 TaxID=2903878 RepID=UPI002E34C92E|nr:GAF domain-containing protein [Streptomyces sp. NBC_01465]